MKKTPVIIMLGMMLVQSAFGISDEMLALLKDSGAVSYAANLDYGSGVSEMAIGFDAEGNALVGVASRETKTYRTITTLVSVVPVDGKYKISAATSPNITDIPGAAQGYTKSALEDISGNIFGEAKEVRTLTDSTTGATKYYKAIYVSYGVMVTRVIKELEDPPDWERQQI